MRKITTLASLIVATATVALFAGADWPRFLGPNGSAVSDEKGLPRTWSATENIAWKTAMPGFGSSSPITVGEKIFVTAYSGYGQGKDKVGKPEDLAHHVVCLDGATGKILWDKSTKALLPEEAYKDFFIPQHGYASGTPVSDGKVVYAFFGRSGVYAYTLAGEPLWHGVVGLKTHGWGSGTSPILTGNLLIVNASEESESVVALDKATGKKVWQTPGVVASWSTPTLLDLPGGKQELVVSSHRKVWGLDPATGKELWFCEGIASYICPSVVVHGDVAYVTAGSDPPTMLAVRGGGKGDVTKSHRLWRIAKGPFVPTPLYDNGHLYWVSNPGIACCIKADTGAVVYEQRISDFGTYASLLQADGKLFGVSRNKGAVVLAAGPQFKQLVRNKLDDDSVFNASPVPYRGHLLLRSDRFLYCIGK